MGNKKKKSIIKITVSPQDIKQFPVSEMNIDPYWKDLYVNKLK